MTVFTNNERLDRIILDLDGRANAVLALCVSIIGEIDRGPTISYQRIDQIMENFFSHIAFFHRNAPRTDVIAEAKIQYNDDTYDTGEEYATFVDLMKNVLDHILSVLGEDLYWEVYKYDASYVKTYYTFLVDDDDVQQLKVNLTLVKDFVVVT